MKSKKELYIIAFGLLTALTPFMGLPNSWKDILYVAFGVLVAFLAFLVRRERIGSQAENDVFVENTNTHQSSSHEEQSKSEVHPS